MKIKRLVLKKTKRLKPIKNDILFWYLNLNISKKIDIIINNLYLIKIKKNVN